MNTLRAVLRLIAFLGITLYGATIALVKLRLNGGNLASIAPDFVRWSRRNLKALGVDLHVKGTPPTQPVLFLPNHRSYLDTVFFPLYQMVVFVAKIEVSRWPLIGYATGAVRTIFVDRNDPQSRRNTREEIKQRLAENLSVVVFPEGTTARSPEVKPFRPGMFFVAAEGDIPVMPVAIEYADPDDAFVGDATFLPHFLRTFGKPYTQLYVSFGPILRDSNGENLKLTVESWVKEECSTLQNSLTSTA